MFETPIRSAGLIVGAAAVSVGHWWWRRQRARAIAEDWLRQHNYRVRDLRMPWWNRPRFRMAPFRNNDWAFDLRAIVDDMRLGGTGEVWLRVWMDWLGALNRDVEVAWERMPTEEGGAKPPETQWADAQLAVLRRVAGGEETFRPGGKEPGARAEFDELVEHLLALQRRGLLTCATPIAELRGDAQYAAITNVVLTPEGEERLRAAPPAATG